MISFVRATKEMWLKWFDNNNLVIYFLLQEESLLPDSSMRWWLPQYVHYTNSKKKADLWYEIKSMAYRDGSCLFHAFENLLRCKDKNFVLPNKPHSSNEDVDKYLRRVIVQHIRDNMTKKVKDAIKTSFGKKGRRFESVDAYLNNMRDTDAYGNDVEINAFSQLYNVHVRVISQDGAKYCQDISVIAPNDETRMITLLYSGSAGKQKRQHYDAAVEIDEEVQVPTEDQLMLYRHTEGPNPPSGTSTAPTPVGSTLTTLSACLKMKWYLIHMIVGIIAFFVFPELSWYLSQLPILSSKDWSAYATNFLTVIGLLFAFLVGQAFYFMYQQQEMVNYALFDEINEFDFLTYTTVRLDSSYR
jgi:hypothetical protein